MDDRMFRNAMGKFATGVTVITAEYNGEPHGMTANAFMSVSLNPKLIVVSIGEKARMLEKVNKSGRFAVNILKEDQKEYSMYFAGQIKEKRDIEFASINNVPVLKDALATVVCRTYEKHIAGDHTLFIGEVEEVMMGEGKPLTFFSGKYGKIETTDQ